MQIESSKAPSELPHPVRKVLVTGGTGFLGAYILMNLVQKGIQVRALRRSATLPFFLPDTIAEKVEWVSGDVLDIISLSDAMEGMDGVIHSAAVVSFSRHNRKLMYQVNVDGTTNVVNAAIESRIKRFLHVSSVAAVGRTENTELVNEEKKWQESRNNTHYALSKHKAEIQAWRGFAEGLEGVIINPSTILGFGDWHSSSCAIFKNAYREFPWYTKGINGFVGVEDVAEAVVRLLCSGITNRRFIVNSENWPFQQLFSTMAENFHKKPPHREATATLGEIAWRVEAVKSFLTGKKPLLTRETARLGHSKTSFDNKNLLQALPGFGFKPLKTVIGEACKKYGEAMRNGVITL